MNEMTEARAGELIRTKGRDELTSTSMTLRHRDFVRAYHLFLADFILVVSEG